MRNPTSCALAVLALILPLRPLDAQGSRGALTPGSFAITGVTVVPMTKDTVIRDATVLVRDGRIAEVGATRNVRVPSGVRRIDGRGRYLVPGLADMHAHLYSDGDVPDSVAKYELGVMVANGVTATRFMIGTREHFALRRDVEAGRIVGPSSGSPARSSPGRRT